MEKRKAERVQLFNLLNDHHLQPVWVFRHTLPDAVLGLLLDISGDGVQVLTDQNTPLEGEVFQLMVHGDGGHDDIFITAIVSIKWSKDEGTLYRRNGFAFEEDVQVVAGLERILKTRQSGNAPIRCELLAV